MEHIDLKVSSDSKLQIHSTWFNRNSDRKWDIIEKLIEIMIFWKYLNF